MNIFIKYIIIEIFKCGQEWKDIKMKYLILKAQVPM